MPLFPSVPLDEDRLRELVAACRKAGVRYGLGSKAPSLTAVPGRDFGAIDCSGFVRWALYQASDGRLKLPDGSVNQQDWVRANNYKKSDIEAGKLADGRVRIAFMSPSDGGGVGHVALVLNGKTLESHGGKGPNRRAWTGAGWQAKARVYVLEMDADGAGED